MGMSDKSGLVGTVISSDIHEAVQRRVRQIDGLLHTDGGGLELVDVSADGTVRVRFDGFCVSCPMRPLTAASTVRPLLAAVSGVRSVEIAGCRLSAEAEERMAHYGVGGCHVVAHIAKDQES